MWYASNTSKFDEYRNKAIEVHPMSLHIHQSRSATTISVVSFLTLFVIGTDTFLVAPLLPLLRDVTNVSVTRSGWLVSAYALGYAMAALVAGPWSDRVDRRRVLLVGLAGFIVFTAACALTWGFWSLVAMRFMAGAAAAFVTPQIWAAIPVLVVPERVIPTMGAATAGLSIAQVAGIPLGSLLSTLSWRYPFLAVSTMAVLLWTVLVLVFPHVSPSAAIGQSRLFSPYATVAASRPLVLSLVAYLVFQTGNFTGLSFIATWFAEDFHATQITVSITMMIIGCGNAIGSLYGSRVVARIGPSRSHLFGLILLGICYFGCAFASSIIAAIILLAGAMLVGGFVFPVLMNHLQTHAATARGTVSALSNTAMYLGTTLSGAVGGVLISVFPGYSGISWFIAVTLTAALVLYAAAGTFRTATR